MHACREDEIGLAGCRSWRRCQYAAALLVAALTGCGGGQTDGADSQAAEPAANSKSPPTASIAAATPDKKDSDESATSAANQSQPEAAAATDPHGDKPLVVPENATVEELLEFIRTTRTTNILAESEEDYIAKVLRRANVILTAADRILSVQTSSAVRYEAAVNKFNAVQDLRQFGAPEGDAAQQAFAAEIVEIVDSIIADPTTAATLHSQAIALKLNAIFPMANQSDDATEAFLKELSLAIADKDPAVVNVARQINAHYRMALFTSGKERDLKSLFDAVAAVVSTDPPDPAFFSQLRDMVAELEHEGSVEAAELLAGTVGAAYMRSDNQQIAEFAKLWSDSVKRRLGVVGKAVTIEGTLAGGQPLDWPALRGKVVLVDFWATWCGPCIESLPELEALYEQYHGQGFEIVGVSLDDSRAKLDGFLARRPLPWPIVANMLDQPQGSPEPNAERYGVDGIPWVILVDKQGQAAAVGLRGEQLEARVKELLAR
jgi:thiol-disulfide isomerase/thioredoxin